MVTEGRETILIHKDAIGSELLGNLDVRYMPKEVFHVGTNLRDSVAEWRMFGAKVRVHYTADENPRAKVVSIRGETESRDRAYHFMAGLAGGALN